LWLPLATDEILWSATVSTEKALVNVLWKTYYVQDVLNIVALFCKELLRRYYMGCEHEDTGIKNEGT
jgi:hypothetical protein